jgi:hypothetical protein
MPFCSKKQRAEAEFGKGGKTFIYEEVEDENHNEDGGDSRHE